MTDMIKALQDEIEAANEKRANAAKQWNFTEAEKLSNYIDGLQTAVDLLTKEQARELQA